MAGEFNAGSVVAKLKLVDDGFGAKIGDASSATAKFQKGLMAAGAAAVAIGTTVATLTQQAADYTDKLGKMAQQIGMTTEQLSSYSLAASLSDISTEEFGKSVSLLSRKMVDAASGNEEATKSFAQLGISVKNANGSLKTSDQVLEEIADKFAGAKDSATKTALAMDLMGRSGASMIPLLNGGAKEIQNIRTEAQRMGLVFSQDAFKAAEQFNDAQTRIGQSLIGLRQQIGQTIISLVNQTGVFDVISQSIQRLTGWWMSLSESSREAGLATAGVIAVGLAVAGALAAFGAVAAALMAVAAATYLVLKYWNNLAALFVTLKPIIDPIFNAFKTFLQLAWAPVIHAVETISNFFKGTKGFQIPDLTLMVITNLVNPIEKFGMHVAAIFGQFLPEAFQKFLSKTMEMIRNWGDTIKSVIKNAMTPGSKVSAIDIIRDQFKETMVQSETFVAEMSDLYNKISDKAIKSAKISADGRIAYYKKELAERDRLSKEAEDKGDKKEIEGPAPSAPKNAVLAKIGEGADMLAGPMQQVQQWFDRITNLMSKLSADQAQIAQNRITTLSNFGSLWAEVHMKNVEKAHEAERAELQEHEDAKLSVIRNALDIKLSLINEEFAARKLALEAELAAQKAGIDAMTAARVAEAEAKSVDAEERTAAVATIEEDGMRLKEEADKEHQAKVDGERTKFQAKSAVETKKANDEYEAEKQASAKRMVALEKKQADEKKDISKKSAAFQYALSVAGFMITQQQAIAQARFQYAQAMMGAVATGMQFGVAAIVAIPALMAMANMAYMSSVAAIHSTPPPMPPAELFAENGGMVPGPRHSQGGVRAELEGGEFIMPRGPAMANLAMLEAMRSGRDNAGGGVTVIMHVGSMDPAGRSVESVGRELGLSVRAHL
jgi:hypothetical protein